jgi:hypothetical protein
MDCFRQSRIRDTIDQVRRMTDSSCRSIKKSQKALIDARRVVERQQKQIAEFHKLMERRRQLGL